MTSYPAIRRRRPGEKTSHATELDLLDIESNIYQRQGKLGDRPPLRLPGAVTAPAAKQHRNFKIGPRALQVQCLERDLEGLQARRKRTLIKDARGDVRLNPPGKFSHTKMGGVFRLGGRVVEHEGSWLAREELRRYRNRDRRITRADDNLTEHRGTVWHSYLVCDRWSWSWSEIYGIRPDTRRVAMPRTRAAASPRRCTWSFSRMLCTWFFTVATSIPRSRAISLFESPRSMRPTISRSRLVSCARGSPPPFPAARAATRRSRLAGIAMSTRTTSAWRSGREARASSRRAAVAATQIRESRLST